jgi:predicted transcriptional regulator
MPLTDTGWSHRGWLDIINEILIICQDGELKYKVMYKTKLNSREINTYMEFLVATGMLETSRKSPVSKRLIYKTSPKGKEFVTRYKELIDLFKIQQIIRQ